MAAVQRNGRVAERIVIMNEGAGALIARLGHVSAILSSQEGRRDLPWTDQKMKKVVACLQVALTPKLCPRGACNPPLDGSPSEVKSQSVTS